MSQPIKNLIQNLIDPSSDWKIELLSRWAEIIGELKTKIRLEKIENDTLIIGVYDSFWMQELFLLSNVLIKKINKVISQDKIKKLKFKLIEEKLKKNNLKIFKSNINNNYKIEPKHKQALLKIKDEQLKQSLEQYLIQCLKNS